MFSLLKRRGARDLSGGQVMVTMWLRKNVPRRLLVSLAVSVTYKDWTRWNTHWNILCKYVWAEVSISPAAHVCLPISSTLMPTLVLKGASSRVFITFLQYKITSDRGWHSSPRLPPCLLHEWAWKELLYQRCGQRTPPVGIQAISPVTQPAYHQPSLTSWFQGSQPSRSRCFQLKGLRPSVLIGRGDFFFSPQQPGFTCTVLRVKSERPLGYLWEMVTIRVYNWTDTTVRLVDVLFSEGKSGRKAEEQLGTRKREQTSTTITTEKINSRNRWRKSQPKHVTLGFLPTLLPGGY